MKENGNGRQKGAGW